MLEFLGEVERGKLTIIGDTDAALGLGEATVGGIFLDLLERFGVEGLAIPEREFSEISGAMKPSGEENASSFSLK